MSDMKCPICGNTLEQSDGFPELFMCLNCQINMKHNQWQELIRTRKALDIARNGLEYIFGYEGVPEYVAKHVRQVLDQIKSETALEQKD